MDLAGAKLQVIEKGSKGRTVDIHPQLREAFERCPPVAGSRYWFGDLPRAEANATGRELCQFIRDVTGLKGEKGRFHNCRHTFAITLLRQGTPVPVVAKLMGHKSIETTMIYLRVEDQDKAKAVAALPVIQFAR